MHKHVSRKLIERKIEALVTLQIHLRDSAEVLYRARIRSVTAFEWLRMFRVSIHPMLYSRLEDVADARAAMFHRQKKAPEPPFEPKTESAFRVDMMGCTQHYCCEYTGCAVRLVVTPLTERCQQTILLSLMLHRGASPTGPAGTGKTETVKDLGRALGKFVVVQNCSEQLTVHGLGQTLRGLAQSGAWGCFDEFNRIDVPVLSVAAQQCATIFSARRSQKFKEFTFVDGQPCRLSAEMGMFITMNPPEYGGRSELPDNLKALFRPILMMAPERKAIIRVKLFAAGFFSSEALSKKLHHFYDLCKMQFSKQPHYDFGLRSILSVLKALKRECQGSNSNSNSSSNSNSNSNSNSPPNLNEASKLRLVYETRKMVSIIQALSKPRLTPADCSLMEGLLKDIFGDVISNNPSNHEGKTLKLEGLETTPVFIEKLAQLQKVSESRSGTVLLGPTLTGKTSLIRALCATDQFQIAQLFPKALEGKRLFGTLDLVTLDWTEGVVTRLWRRALTRNATHQERTAILFDGPVDPVWIENLNSVLDDNRVLTLANGDRLPLIQGMKILFEVAELSRASPATISRVGIVHTSQDSDNNSNFGDGVIAWRDILARWCRSKGHLLNLLKARLEEGSRWHQYLHS